MDAGAQMAKRGCACPSSTQDMPDPDPDSVLDENGFEFAYLDMGWEGVMIAVEYDGDHHRTDRTTYAWDVIRLRKIQRAGWLHVRVIKKDRPRDILDRVRAAWVRRRGTEGRVA